LGDLHFFRLAGVFSVDFVDGAFIVTGFPQRQVAAFKLKLPS
jgi:hypothetical protein